MKSTNEYIYKKSSKLNTAFLFVKTYYIHWHWPHCFSPLLFLEQRVESQGFALTRLESVNKASVAKGLMRVEKTQRETERERNETLSFQELYSKPKPESSLKHDIFCYCISLLGFSIVVFLGSFLRSVFYAHKVFDEMSLCTLRSFLFNSVCLPRKLWKINNGL